jgi:hypothetical protein
MRERSGLVEQPGLEVGAAEVERDHPVLTHRVS